MASRRVRHYATCKGAAFRRARNTALAPRSHGHAGAPMTRASSIRPVRECTSQCSSVLRHSTGLWKSVSRTTGIRAENDLV